jgi:hypothetical protein
VKVIASDFASLADLEAFTKAKAAGWSDKRAFAVGDNGIGCWGDLTAQTHSPMCALPPETMADAYGSAAAAKHQRVRVKLCHGKSVICVIADRMPHRANITNGCGIDLNPAALRALGLKSPIKTEVEIEFLR